jgi:hypothetical protein
MGGLGTPPTAYVGRPVPAPQFGNKLFLLVIYERISENFFPEKSALYHRIALW